MVQNTATIPLSDLEDSRLLSGATGWDAGVIVTLLSVFLLATAFSGKHFGITKYIPREISRRISSWRYLLDGPRIIQNGFDQAKGQPYEINAPDCRYVFVSSKEHIKELDSAPDTVLSLQAASKQMLQPVYTMHGFNWFDRRGTEGVGFVRALRTLLTNHLPEILPDLGVIIRARFDEMHQQNPIVDGARHTPVYPTILKIVVMTNAVSFFGPSLAKNENFMVSALAFIEETLICAEIVKLMPKCMAPLIGKIIAHYLKSHEVIFETLLPIAEQRCLERDLATQGRPIPKHADCIQWIMETSPRQKPWTPTRVVYELIAIWFGSVHALSTTITFAIHDLCLHPEYVEPLRKEADRDYAKFERTARGLPLLDSFIKESARLTPVESMSTRRCATQPFSLSDGTKVAVGDWACTPVRAIMQSAEYYPEPLQFNGFRFAKPEDLPDAGTESKFGFLQPEPSKLTDVDQSWHVWGTGRMACPGRYYATAVMKVIMGQIILNYDCELVDPNAERWLTWRSTILPQTKTMVIFKPREISY